MNKSVIVVPAVVLAVSMGVFLFVRSGRNSGNQSDEEPAIPNHKETHSLNDRQPAEPVTIEQKLLTYDAQAHQTAVQDIVDRIQRGMKMSQWDKATEPEQIERFDSTRGENFSPAASFLFVDGQYVSQPYQVSQKGLAILVNSIQLDSTAWPSTSHVAEKPELPKQLTRNATLADLKKADPEGAGWTFRYNRWLASHLPSDEVNRRILEDYRTFPFVKSIETGIGNFGSQHYLVTLHSGESFKFGKVSSSSYADLRQPPVQKVKQDLATARTQWEESLKTGRFHHKLVFLCPLAPYTCEAPSNSDAYKNLPEIVAVLEAKLPGEQKVKQLVPLFGNSLDDRNAFEKVEFLAHLVHHWKGVPPQLQERLEQMKQARQ